MKRNLISTWLHPGVMDDESRPAVSTACRISERDNPKWIESFSPGLRGTSYPGFAVARFPTPTGLSHVVAAGPQPRWGWFPSARIPRVARSSQPWALSRNPFGILSGLVQKRLGWSVALLVLVLLASCSKKDAAPSEEKKSAEPESRVHHGTNGDVTITLDAATQKLMGLQTAPLAAAELPPETKGFGRVLDPGALAAAVTDFVSAQATAAASHKELARLKTLTEQTNTTPRALEAGEAAAQRDQAQVAAARARLLAVAGKTLSERSDLVAVMQALVTGESALVRIELPAGEGLKSDPVGARLLTLDENAPPLEAKFVGPAPAVDPQTQAQGFLFLVEANASQLAPGAAVTGFLKSSRAAQAGVLVPRGAILRFNGATWIYLETGEEKFSRVEVALGSPLTDGWFVREGLKPQDKVVTVGAQQLLSEELKGRGGE